MNIRRIILENVKGFGRIDLNLARGPGGEMRTLSGWHVIAGPNGSGKTTMLQAVALALAGPARAAKLVLSGSSWVRRGATRGYCGVMLGAGPGDRVEDPEGAAEKGDADMASVALGRQAARPIFETRRWSPVNAKQPLWSGIEFGSAAASPKHVGRKGRGAEATVRRGAWAQQPRGWFAVGYGPFRRISGGTAEASDLMNGPPALARLGGLFRSDATFSESLDWLLRVHTLRLEGNDAAHQVLRIVREILDGGMLSEGMSVAEINSGGLHLDDSGTRLTLDELGDGYKVTIAFAIDLLRHLYGAGRGGVMVEDAKGYVEILDDGVVLIDEAELHLHPSWQQALPVALTRRFPNLQFLVTTHSPFVAQAASPGSIVRLWRAPDGIDGAVLNEEHTRRVLSGTIDDAVVSEAFGLPHAHSPRAEASITRLAALEAKLLEGAATAAERDEFERLRRLVAPGAEVQALLRSTGSL